MARNEWINGYLEAILDAGAGRGGVHGNNSSRSGNEKKRFEEKLRLEQFDHDIDKEKGDNKLISTTKYFVEEVVNGFDESDLYRTWIKELRELILIRLAFWLKAASKELHFSVSDFLYNISGVRQVGGMCTSFL